MPVLLPMPARARSRRVALRALAAALAVGYAFLAAVGDGLHGLVCLDECCGGTACSGGVDEDHCLFCHHQDGHHQEGGHHQEDSRGAGQGSHSGVPEKSQIPQPHDSDCDVCRLLAQLKTATATVEVPALVIWAPVATRPESDSTAPSLSLPATSARGPPIA